MDIYNEIKKNVPDLERAKLTYSYVMSRGEAQEKVEKLEKELGGIAVYFNLTGKKLEIFYSPELKKKWGESVKGKKVRLVIKDVKGNVIDSLSREGIVTSEELFFVSGSRCVRCQFEKENDAYDIGTLEVIE